MEERIHLADFTKNGCPKCQSRDHIQWDMTEGENSADLKCTNCNWKGRIDEYWITEKV